MIDGPKVYEQKFKGLRVWKSACRITVQVCAFR